MKTTASLSLTAAEQPSYSQERTIGLLFLASITFVGPVTGFFLGYPISFIANSVSVAPLILYYAAAVLRRRVGVLATRKRVIGLLPIAVIAVVITLITGLFLIGTSGFCCVYASYYGLPLPWRIYSVIEIYAFWRYIWVFFALDVLIYMTLGYAVLGMCKYWTARKSSTE